MMHWPSRKPSLCLPVLLLAVAFVATAPLSAGIVGLDLSGGSVFDCPSGYAPGCVAGFGFHVNSAVTVVGLGLWDQGSDGLVEDHPVGLWTIGNSLLASATVTNLGDVVASGDPGGRWLFVSIASTPLAPGTYVLGAYYSARAAGDGLRGQSSASTAPQISLVDARDDLFMPALAMPTSPFPGYNDGFFGPNLMFADVPEPSAALLVATGIGCLLLRRRRV